MQQWTRQDHDLNPFVKLDTIERTNAHSDVRSVHYTCAAAVDGAREAWEERKGKGGEARRSQLGGRG